MSKHTLGPWKVDIPNDSVMAFCGIHAGDYVIADICNDGYEREEQEANARLIAAAPELLEALQAAVELMEQEDFATATIVPHLRAAIAKATGETP